MERIKILDYIFPRRCPYCHEVTRPFHGDICNVHEAAFSFITGPACCVCGKEILSAEGELCDDCRTDRKSFVKNFPLMNYDDAARASMSMFKYNGRREYADYYARKILERYGRDFRQLNIDLIIPVPLHKSRRYKRGYNQAYEIARRIARGTDVPVREDVLVREKMTRAQKELGATERFRNIMDSMRVKKDLTGIGTVLLVDDIYTTGSTLAACSKVLLAAGAGKVYTCTVCIGRDT